MRIPRPCIRRACDAVEGSRISHGFVITALGRSAKAPASSAPGMRTRSYGSDETPQAGSDDIVRIEIPVNQHLRYGKRAEQPRKFTAQAAWESIDNQAAIICGSRSPEGASAGARSRSSEGSRAIRSSSGIAFATCSRKASWSSMRI